MARWSGEVQVNIRLMSKLNLSLTLVDVKLVSILALIMHFYPVLKPQKLAGYKKVSENLHA